MEGDCKARLNNHSSESGVFSATSLYDEEYVDDQNLGRGEPEIICRHLDLVNMSGLNMTSMLRLQTIIR